MNAIKRQINNTHDLMQAIAELEHRAAFQKKDIQETFAAVSENLKPMNIIKSGVRSVFSGEHKEDLVNALLGLGTGFLSRKLILGRTSGIVGKTVGKAIQWGMAGLVSKNAEKIKEKAGELIDKIFKKDKTGSNHSAVSDKSTIIP
jgi:hypothetical protein